MTAIKPRTARVVIYQGDDLARLSELDAVVKRAEVAKDDAEKAAKTAEKRTASLDEVDDSADRLVAARDAHNEAVAERDTFAEEAEERGVVVTLHAQPRKSWRRLIEEHPARDREEHPEDYPIGPCNISTLPDELLPMSIDREQSTIEGDLTEFLESISDYDYYDRLFLTAFSLNRGSALADPTLRLGSAPSQISAETLS